MLSPLPLKPGLGQEIRLKPRSLLSLNAQGSRRIGLYA